MLKIKNIPINLKYMYLSFHTQKGERALTKKGLRKRPAALLLEEANNKRDAILQTSAFWDISAFGWGLVMCLRVQTTASKISNTSNDKQKSNRKRLKCHN